MSDSNFSTLENAYAWLDSHVNYEAKLDHITYDAKTFELEEFRGRLGRLGDPHLSGGSIHIAGTRGKGTAALFLERLLMAHGLSVATFTSPHLREYRERIRISGAPISPEQFIRMLEKLRCHDETQPGAESQATPTSVPPARGPEASFKTVFEHLTAMFFLAAREAKVDWRVVETGLGGRLDATNVLGPGPVLLTRIGLEHTHLLGSTYEAIAGEKAAILKAGGWGVAGRQDEQHGALDVFRGRASAVVAPLVRAEEFCPLLSAHFSPSGMKLDYLFMGRELQLDLPLYGTFIAENLQNALALFATLAEHRLIPQPDPRKIADSLSSISIPGRMEPLAEYPRMILDCGHCPTAAAAISETMESHFDSEPAVAVIGMAVDKDHAGFFEALARWKGWKGMVCYTLPHPRGASAETLASRAAPYFPSVLWRTNLSEALELADSLTENYTRLIAAGSAYGVGPASDWGKTHGRRSAPRKNRT